MTPAQALIRLAVAALVLAVPNTCGLDQMTGPGQVDVRATLTVINRTEAEVTISSGQQSFSVPACDELTLPDFPVNWWRLTSPGRDTFHSGGGDHGPKSYLVVTSVASQQPNRPDPLPPCEGQLQSG